MGTGPCPWMSALNAPSLLTSFAVVVTRLPSCLLGTGGGLLGGGSGLLRHSRPQGAPILSAAAPGCGAPLVSSHHSEVRPFLGQLVQFLRRGGTVAGGIILFSATGLTGGLCCLFSAHVAGEQKGKTDREKLLPCAFLTFSSFFEKLVNITVLCSPVLDNVETSLGQSPQQEAVRAGSLPLRDPGPRMQDAAPRGPDA